MQARPELNGSTYQCVPTTIGVNGVFLSVTREGVARTPVTLTVTSSGKVERHAVFSSTILRLLGFSSAVNIIHTDRCCVGLFPVTIRRMLVD